MQTPTVFKVSGKGGRGEEEEDAGDALDIAALVNSRDATGTGTGTGTGTMLGKVDVKNPWACLARRMGGTSTVLIQYSTVLIQ